MNETEAVMLSLCEPEDIEKQTVWTNVAEYFLNRGLKNGVVTLGKKGAHHSNESVSGYVEAEKNCTVLDTSGAGCVPVALRPFHRPICVFLVGTNRGIIGDSFLVGYAAQYMAQKQKGQWDIKAAVQYG